MALSVNGRRIGMAAHNERVERAYELDDAYWREQEKRHEIGAQWKKALADGVWAEEWWSALETLKALDADGWERWYDEEPEQTPSGMLMKIDARIIQLRSGQPATTAKLDTVS